MKHDDPDHVDPFIADKMRQIVKIIGVEKAERLLRRIAAEPTPSSEPTPLSRLSADGNYYMVDPLKPPRFVVPVKMIELVCQNDPRHGSLFCPMTHLDITTSGHTDKSCAVCGGTMVARKDAP